MADIGIEIRVNGRLRRASVQPRLTLVDFLRERCQLTGTHVGCEHGVCGACTVCSSSPTRTERAVARPTARRSVRAWSSPCRPTAARSPRSRASARARRDGALSAVQAAFREHHALQCGFCTPGFVISATAFLQEHPDPTDEQIRDALSGNLCRCTGYQGILAAVRAAADSLPDGSQEDPPTHEPR